MAGSVLDQIGGYLPKLNLASVGNFAFIATISVLVLIIVGSLVGLWAWNYINKKRYNNTIIIFEKIDNRYKDTMSDKAMERKIGTGGDTVFYWKKLKKIVPKPSIQTGIRKYWFARREDGEYINIGMEDVDLKMREAKIYYNENEQRYARASLQKLNKDRFNRETFWQKYGRDIMTVIFIVIISIMLMLILSRVVELTGKIGGLIETASKLNDATSKMLGSMSNICSGAPGVKSA
jgi:hypothetical protein